MKKTAIVVALTCALLAARTVRAEDNTLNTVFKDALYGGLIGALVGGAALAFADHPGDHLNYIGVGAAVGVIGGTAFGLVQSSRAFAEIENGKVAVSVPSVKTVLSNDGLGGTIAQRNIDLVRFKF